MRSSVIRNRIFDYLCSLGICDSGELEKIHDSTRDRKDIEVYRCKRSGAVFLSSSDHMSLEHYDKKEPTHRYGTDKREIVNTNEDSIRRANRFANLIRGKRWLDIGAGSGAVLDRLSPLALEAYAVEPQEEAAAVLRALGYQVYRRLEDINISAIDCVTLFHVLEHVTEPADMLHRIYELMASGGRLVVEVPHASDLLIKHFDLECFKDFTFWSEHLVLHTRQTLQAMVAAAGFENIVIEGIQRYPVANHLYWLSNAKPGGHLNFDFLRDDDLDKAYETVLQKLDMTDTLVLTALKT